ncbi:GNAT family N-acetyltransferase [Listeria booriae]|uniref:GNAT family N-acetyltransferase n=1 Tax=Listeria booriae TaxID=1552123 RepID=UPI001625192B|nr:GNAT family N-acetyltransferase [Listeria booriae]MBC1210536.1 GNAT family N-acetyltransferase [Listeria booriae]MBC1228198.1 GNAT family N-acetyltransferase [Listeria booriae]MBC6134272.1 GNAT family N-acetyltransferase [Listeria booriae]
MNNDGNQKSDEINIFSLHALVSHDEIVGPFECGIELLNEFIRAEAVKQDSEMLNATTIMMIGDELIGYFTICAGEVNLAKKFKRSNTKYFTNQKRVYPAFKITHFAIKEKYQGQGYGSTLMNALFKICSVNISPYVKFPVLVVDSLNEESTKFYKSMGFTDIVKYSGVGEHLMGIATKQVQETIFREMEDMLQD